jgi:hypothetical protein
MQTIQVITTSFKCYTNCIRFKAPLNSVLYRNGYRCYSAMVGLGNADNTSDLNKPVSNATQTALDLKVNLTSFHRNKRQV